MDAGKRALYRRIADLHMANIDQGFLRTLGIAFVTLMYRAIDEGQDSVLIVAKRDMRVVGFVSGTTSMRSVYKGMLRHGLSLAAALLPSVFRPSRVWRIIEILRYSHSAESSVRLPGAELLSIAVDRDCRGQQAADMLYRQLCEYFAARNVQQFKIIVGSALGPAHAFYRRMGATPVEEVEVHEGSHSVVYVQNLTQPKP